MKIVKHIIALLGVTALLNLGTIIYAEESPTTETSSVTEPTVEATTENVNSNQNDDSEDSTEEDTDTKKWITITYYYDTETVWMDISWYTDRVGVGQKQGPPAPNEGYRFLYWEYMKDGEMVKVPDDMVFYEDVNVYACWEILIDPNYPDVLKSIEEGYKNQEKLENARYEAGSIRYLKPIFSSVKNNKRKTITVKASLNYTKDGFEIQYATSKKFKKAKTVTVETTKKKLDKKIKKLKKRKTYYVRIRVYKIFDPSIYDSDDPQKIYYSKWSNVRKITIIK